MCFVVGVRRAILEGLLEELVLPPGMVLQLVSPVPGEDGWRGVWVRVVRGDLGGGLVVVGMILAWRDGLELSCDRSQRCWLPYEEPDLLERLGAALWEWCG